MGSRRVINQIRVADLVQAFEAAEENLENDISVIRVILTHDVHFDSLELNVTVFGISSDEEDAPVGEFLVDPDSLATTDQLCNVGIKPARLRALFSEGVWHLIIGLNIPVQFFCDDGSFVTVSLMTGEDNGIMLKPVDQ